MKVLVLLCLILGSALAGASPVEVDYATEFTVEDYEKNSWANPHRARGQHQCQSDSSLGHRCEVLGVNFTDCNQAALKLKREDCCSGSRHGGVSIGFKMTYCGRL